MRDIGPDRGLSHSVLVSVRSITSSIALSPSSGGSNVLALRAAVGCIFGVLDVREDASLRSQFRLVLGNEVRVDFPDTRSTPGAPQLAVFASTRPRGSCLQVDMDALDVLSTGLVDDPTGQIADALEVLVRGRALKSAVCKPVRLAVPLLPRDRSRSFSFARAATRCFFSEF